MPAAAASRDIAAMKALKSPPHCAAGAALANKTERTNAASRRLIMLEPFFRRRGRTQLAAILAAAHQPVISGHIAQKARLPFALTIVR